MRNEIIAFRELAWSREIARETIAWTLRAQSEQELLEACRSRSTGSRFGYRPIGAQR